MRKTIENFKKDDWYRPGPGGTSKKEKPFAEDVFYSIFNHLLHVAVKRGTQGDRLIVGRFSKLLGANIARRHLDRAVADNDKAMVMVISPQWQQHWRIRIDGRDGRLVLGLLSLVGWGYFGSELKEIYPRIIRAIRHTNSKRCHRLFWPHLIELDGNLDSEFSAQYLVALLAYGSLWLFDEFVNFVDSKRGASGLNFLCTLIKTVTTPSQLDMILHGMLVCAVKIEEVMGNEVMGNENSGRRSGGGSGGGSGGRIRYTAAFLLYLQKCDMLPDFGTLGMQHLFQLLVMGGYCSYHNVGAFKFFLDHYIGNKSGDGIIDNSGVFAKYCVTANLSGSFDIQPQEIGTENDFLHLAVTHGLVGPEDVFPVLVEVIRHRYDNSFRYLHYMVLYGVDLSEVQVRLNASNPTDFWLAIAQVLEDELRGEGSGGEGGEVHDILRLFNAEHLEALSKAVATAESSEFKFLTPLLVSAAGVGGDDEEILYIVKDGVM
ncbi:hypothetical protein HK102_009593 [Quaeritorhiza haematococci]|nr:hypothetical protein HK102_009593 [Quaeritorhiza haematococci]